MRIAVLSDIHGNLAALEAVLADMAARGIDLIVNLGDILSGPLWPAETADRLMPLGLPTIRGNHERQLLTLPPERMNASDRYTMTRLSAAHLAWLATLPTTLRLTDNVLMVHGTPASDIAYWLQTVMPGGVRNATPAEIAERLGDAAAATILCGHTHLPGVARARRAMIVNPGSVGLPAYDDDQPHPHMMESGTPHARYAIIEDGEAELLAVAYDWESAARRAEANERPDWAKALRTGRM